jgi:signal transduction histidine kinase
VTTLELVLMAGLALSLAGNALALGRRHRAALAEPDHGTRAATAAVERERALVEQGAADERARIHADLHDDLGAGLLELVYAAPDPGSAERARALLQTLRDVVARARGEPGTLADVLEAIRAEAARRLAGAGLTLAWQAADDLPDPALDSASALHLHRIVREAISNALRHGGASSLRVRVRLAPDGMLMLELTDDGQADLAALDGAGGRGVRNMRERAAELRGRIDFSTGTLGGTRVLLKAPLPDAPPA